MSDRDDFVVSYQTFFGVREVEAEQVLRRVELAYAEQQNAELQKALDDADGQHLSQTEELRAQNGVLQRMLEQIPETHMRFGVRNPDGTVEEATQCADWCHACKLERLQSDVAFRIRAELVCCGIYDRVNDKHEMTIAQAMESPDWHDLCYWGEAAARLAEGRCPGYETDPNICRCACEGCKHSCSGHVEPTS
jgi:hypothetical protein